MNALPETPFTQEGIIFDTFRTLSQVSNRRREKEYALTVGLGADFAVPYNSGMSTPFPGMEKRLQDTFSVTWPNTSIYVGGGWGKYSTSVVFRFDAEKPSEIISEEEAWAQLPWNKQEISTMLVEAVVQSHQEWREAQALEDRVRKATHIRGWIVQEMNSQAKSNMLYKERLKLLQEEYTLAAQAAFNTGWEGLQKAILEKHPEYDPRSVRAAFSTAKDLLGGHDDPFRSSPKPVPEDLVK